MREQQEISFSNEDLIYQTIQDSHNLTLDQKNRLIAEISEKINKKQMDVPFEEKIHADTALPLHKDTENLKTAEFRFFPGHMEQPISLVKHKSNELSEPSQINIKRRSSGRKPPILDLSAFGGNRPRSGSPSKRNNYSSPEESPKQNSPISPNNEMSPNAKDSPGKSPRLLLSKSIKRKKSIGSQNAVTKNIAIPMPIDKKTAVQYLRKIQVTHIESSKCIHSFDNQYRILIIPTDNKTIKYYLLDEKQLIAEGGYAKVFATFDLETDELVVAKIFKPNIVQKSHLYREINNLRLTNRFCGAYLAQPGEKQDSIILQKYFPGVTLLNILYQVDKSVPEHNINFCAQRKTNIPMLLKLKLAYKILENLEYFHNMNLLYRDLKPGNILVDTEEDGNVNVKIIDLDAAISEPHKNEEMVSTKGYIPPEILERSGCGLVKLSRDPLSIRFNQLKNIIHNNHALILHNKCFFYADNTKKEIISLDVTDSQKKELINLFPNTADCYQEAAVGLRSKIVKLTGRSLKHLYNKTGDFFQAGIVIAEIISEKNYQKKRIKFLLKNDQNIPLESIRNMMNDVFMDKKSPDNKKNHEITTDNIVDIICHSLIYKTLRDLTIRLVYPRLKNSSLTIEIEQLKKLELFCLKINGMANTLSKHTEKAQNSCQILIDEIIKNKKNTSLHSPHIQQELYDQIIQNISELFIKPFTLNLEGKEISNDMNTLRFSL